MLPISEFSALDRSAEFFGVSIAQLMENAGEGISKEILKHHPPPHRLLFVCGTGNNGGDGFAAAHKLAGKGYEIRIFLAEPTEKIKGKESRENFERARKLVSYESIEKLLDWADVVLDCLLGTGLEGKPREPYSGIIKTLNKSRKLIISIDVPSGFPSSLSVKPSLTLTLHDTKEGMNKNNSGKIIIVPIGFPAGVESIVNPAILSLLDSRPEESHKGQNGSVLIIGGGPYVGAPALAGLAAQRCGIDLIYVAVPSSVFTAVAGFSPTLITKELSGNIFTEHSVHTSLNMAQKASAVLIGNGLGDSKETAHAVRFFLKKLNKPVVIDADAIAAVGAEPKILKAFRGRAIVTPHSHEFKELTGKTVPQDLEKRKKLVSAEAKKLGCTILLKGRTDVISNGAETKTNITGSRAMAVGGTGDTLAGITAAFLSKGLEPVKAAEAAAFVNGYAGELATAEYGLSMAATDLIWKIPDVFKKFLPEWTEK
ncbi:MAG: NAD(P)H-hydrate dehydratase [Candidatus Aenigmarchaeota archaeon]|nr:NAD(P)H-hydrate dehydratase [Candidatus Aenigmarchaeota archaeon]